jgi:F-type H+-transporting ATPase subunit delta
MIAASRYAKSLMDLALESNQMDQVRNDMKVVQQLCETNRDFSLFLKSPIIKTDKKLEVLKTIFDNKISSLSLSFLDLITSKNREAFIHEIAQAFEELFKTKKNIFSAVVTSANGLDATTREKVLDLIKLQMQGEVELLEKIDPATIGGFILKIGDKQIDRTVARQLSNLKKQLTSKN